MAKRKADAERALRTVAAAPVAAAPVAAAPKAAAPKAAAPKAAPEGGDVAPLRAPQGPAPRAARSAPRRADGSFGPQACSVDDPTSSGCLTPRMAHALQQARAAGFTRYTACFRRASFGEHPLGRACDFSASAKGFGGTATGGDKAYGDRLANYLINNSDRLGVLYVIWFRRIWLPSSGWRAYSGGGSPSAAHTNHVHLSVR